MKHLSFLFLFLLTFELAAQDIPVDSSQNQYPQELQIEKEGVQVKEIQSYANQFVPRKASLYSAVFPGLGQVYNKSYWKLPIIYGGFIGLGVTIDFWQDQNRTFRKDLFALLEDGGSRSPLGLTEAQLRNLVDDTRRERDFFMIMTAVLYFLQIAEAHIDAHLKEFKLNPDLQVKLEPDVNQIQFAQSNAGIQAGFSITLKF